jgi:hypothetical protein
VTVSRDIELYRVLTNIVGVCDQSDCLSPVGVAELSSFTDAAAIQQARALALRALDVLTNADGATAASDARSSVSIETMAKGTPKLTVKAYTGSPVEPALNDAWDNWQALMRRLVEDARVTEKEALNGHA